MANWFNASNQGWSKSAIRLKLKQFGHFKLIDWSVSISTWSYTLIINYIPQHSTWKILTYHWLLLQYIQQGIVPVLDEIVFLLVVDYLFSVKVLKLVFLDFGLWTSFGDNSRGFYKYNEWLASMFLFLSLQRKRFENLPLPPTKLIKNSWLVTQTKKSLVGTNYIWNVWIINEIPLLHWNNKHRIESVKSCPLLKFGKTLDTSGSLVIGLLEIYVGNSVH